MKSDKITRQWAGVFDSCPDGERYFSWGSTTPPSSDDPITQRGYYKFESTPGAIGFFFTKKGEGEALSVPDKSESDLVLRIKLLVRGQDQIPQRRFMEPVELQASITKLIEEAVKHAGNPAWAYIDGDGHNVHCPPLNEMLEEAGILLGAARSIFEKEGMKEHVSVVKNAETALKLNKERMSELHQNHQDETRIARQELAEADQGFRKAMGPLIDRFMATTRGTVAR